ncbi:tetratricopeptide repeat protein [Candidatus Puniceispirillum marinum]|uniref:TPR repeat protein n=1 Tax=Puniceispirillum marinum (strain IMCC1322) TaxID=488538 RepID=D5BUF7_PUNMI|nr:tetratricopeptide repeat protein [Candidatus Puniceispirillum marinum]ADE39904.1 TPR repeat protein [Candidatus Puniceispirillum marinum IMCC1322]
MEQMPNIKQNDRFRVCAQTGHLKLRQIKPLAALAALALFASGCGGTASSSLDMHNTDATDAARAPAQRSEPYNPQSVAAHYLAARQALYMSEIEDSAHFYMRSLEAEPDNIEFLQRNFMSQYYLGHIERAASIGRQLESLNIMTSLSYEPSIAMAIRAGDWDAVMVLVDNVAENIPSRQFAGVIKSWAMIATGRGDAGITHLTDSALSLVDAENGLPFYHQLHHALMFEALGNKDDALLKAQLLIDEQIPSSAMMLDLAGLLYRLDARDMADAMLDQKLPRAFDLKTTRQHLANQANQPPTIAQNIANGVLQTASNAGDGQPQTIGARLRFAIYIAPGLDAVHFSLAQALSMLALDSSAMAVLADIDPDGVWAQPAMLMKLDMLVAQNDFETALSILNAHLAKHPDNGFLHKEHADILRRNGNYAASRDAYLRAESYGFESPTLDRNLAITYEQLGIDDKAEERFLAALTINPNDAFTLNYLGYWWADEGRNLSEAIKLIEKAVELRPESGYFVDSLGWVHYKLGNFAVAVELLEKATTLEPADPVIFDHLGDVYWRLDRYAEARHMWDFAIEQSDDPVLSDTIRTKLSDGLDP